MNRDGGSPAANEIETSRSMGWLMTLRDDVQLIRAVVPLVELLEPLNFK